MTSQKLKLTKEQKDALKSESYKFEAHLRDLENSCLDYRKVIPDWVYKNAERENALGNPYEKKKT